MEIEVRVEPHSSSMKYYQILWRKKKKFNLFNFWEVLVEVWDGACLNYSQPVMFGNLEDGIEYAKKLKSNPNLIEEHYKKQDKIYSDAKERREKEYESRNKTFKI